MGTNNLKVIDELTPRNWRITVKSRDGVVIDYEEPFDGNYRQAKRRAWLMWARTSFVVNARNRDVYTCLEVFDLDRHEYRVIKDKRGRLADNAKAPAGT